MKKPSVTAPSASKPAPVKSVVKPVVAADEKAKVLGFVNWRIYDESGETIERSSNGFKLSDTKWLTKPERTLLAIAKANGGSATIANVEFRVVLMSEEDKPLDISKFKLVTK